MSVDAITLVLIAANVSGAAMAVPQTWKMLRTRTSNGVSLSWAVVSATVNAGWGWYGLGVGDLGIVPVSFVSVLCYLTITVLIVRDRGRAGLMRSAVAAAVVAVTAAAVGALGGWPAAGITLGALYGVQLSPAVVSVYRTFDVSGVSVSTWVIAFGEAALWGVYGFVRADVGLVALAASGVVMSGLVLVRLIARRPRRASGTVGAPGFAVA